jgi:hypothetical protein
MLILPRTHLSLLVRTDFTSEDAWQAVCDEALREYEDGFRAYLEPVSDSAFDGFGTGAQFFQVALLGEEAGEP